MNNKNLYSALSMARFPMILAILFIHSNFLLFALPNRNDISDISVFIAFRDIFDSFVLRLAVPAFFILSGFMFFRNGPELSFNNYTSKLKSRTKSLLIPYIIWNTLGLMTMYVKKLPSLSHNFPQYADYHFTLTDILSGYIRLDNVPYPYDMPLWFIRNLIFVIIFTPAIGVLLKYTKRLTPLVILTAIILSRDIMHFADPLGLLSSFLFFSVGATLACNMRELISVKKPVFTIAIYIVLKTIEYATSDYDNIPMTILTYCATVTGSIGILQLARSMFDKGIEIPEKLEKSSFFIFCMHGLYCSVACKFVCSILPPTDNLLCFIDYFAIFSLLLCTSMITYLILNYFWPRLTAILSGGRS